MPAGTHWNTNYSLRTICLCFKVISNTLRISLFASLFLDSHKIPQTQPTARSCHLLAKYKNSTSHASTVPLAVVKQLPNVYPLFKNNLGNDRVFLSFYKIQLKSQSHSLKMFDGLVGSQPYTLTLTLSLSHTHTHSKQSTLQPKYTYPVTQ